MLDTILYYISSFVDFLRGLNVSNVVRTYWFLFFVEFPRYYILEYGVLFYRFLTRNRRHRRRALARWLLHHDRPLVTILVPGKNEGKNIYKLVTTLREQTYNNFEIIIVDDGSDDDTPLICHDLERAKYITKYLRCNVRGGKASAANFGARIATGKYIVHLDADSSLDRNAIENVLIPFYMDKRVKAGGGCVLVRNYKENICTSLQGYEYLKRIQVGRLVTSQLGIYHIISGAFGAFDAETLKEIGYWDIGPGLDGDITQKVRKAGHRVAFAHNAVCLTNVPTQWYKLYHQRVRWSRSLVRFRLRKHLDILLPNRNWNFLNFLSNMESIFYDCILNFIWWFYIINLIFTFHASFLQIFALGYILRIALNYIGWGLVRIISERPGATYWYLRYLPLMPAYSGWFMRFARTTAQLSELFFFQSYKDNWNPYKTSRSAQLEKI